MKNIAVDGCTFNYLQAKIITPPKTSVKINGCATYSGIVQVEVTNYSSPAVGSQGYGINTLTPTAQYDKIENELVVREEDNTDIVVTGTSGTEVLHVVLINAGQSDVVGE